MLQIQLYIEGQEVELFKDESVTLTQSIQDILDLEKVFTDYSKTFNVPASKLNNKTFKHFYNYYIDGFDGRKTHEAELFLNYKPFKKGRIKLEGTQLKNNEAQSYKITFFGNTVTLKDKFGKEKLSGLEQLDNFSFDYTDTNIEAFMTDGLDGNIAGIDVSDSIIFPLITHTDRLIYDSTDVSAGTKNVYAPITDVNIRGVNFNQLKPAIRLYSIIKAIEFKYDITFSEDFFSKTNLEFFNIYMWLHSKEGGMFADAESEYMVKGFTNVTGDISDIQGVRTDHFVNQFKDDKHERKMIVKVAPSSSSDYSLIVKKDGEEFKKFSNLSNTTFNGESQNGDPFEILNGKYSFYIQSNSAQSFDVQVIIEHKGGFLSSKKEIQFSGNASVGSGERVIISQHVPEMEVIEFLTGIWKMFNLTSFVNDDGIIVVQPLEDFYNSSTQTWDITKHIDKTESVVDAVIPFNMVSMGYEGTETFLANNHLSMSKKKWGSISYKLTEEKGENYSFEIPFEHMKFERLHDAATGQTPIQWGWSVDSKQQPTLGKPLLFYPIRPIGSVAAVNIAGARKTISSPYTPANSLSVSATYGLTNAGQSLNFATEFDEYNTHTNEKTLFKTYYESYIKDIFDKRKRLSFMSAFLPISITKNLSLADKIIVFDKLYRINKMKTNFETNKTEFELTNLLEEPIFQDNVFTLDIPIDTETIFADNTILTADITSTTADGFDFPPETNQVPESTPSNEITNTTTDPCNVTPARIFIPSFTPLFSDKIKFKGTIQGKGILCEQLNVDEYGFLISSTESDLTASDDIDTLKANNNITVVKVQRSIATNEASLTNGTKETMIEGLSNSETRFARFYVRTNIQDIFDKADVISDVVERSTTADVSNSTTATIFVAASAGHHNSGYSSIPTLAEINAKRQQTNAAGRCDEEINHNTAFHNGANTLPILGDKVSLQLTGTPVYTGTTNSFPFYFGSAFNTNVYFAWSVGLATESNKVIGNTYKHTVDKYIVVDYRTAEVVQVYSCPQAQAVTPWNNLVSGNGHPYGFSTIPTSLNDILNSSWYTSLGKTPPSCTGNTNISADATSLHNGQGNFPVVGDKVCLRTDQNFNGGFESFGGIPAGYVVGFGINTDKFYAAFGILDSSIRVGNNFVGFIVVDIRNAEVVARYDCP